MKTKYSELNNHDVTNSLELTSWQKEIIDERLEEYFNDKSDLVEFEVIIDNIRKTI